MGEINIGKNFKFDLDKLGIGQQIGDNNKVDGENKLRNLTAEEISVFNALDEDGNGSLSKSEVDRLKERVANYTKDDSDFSKRDARKLARELGVNAKALMSILQKLCGIAEKVSSTEYDDGTYGVIESIPGSNTIKKEIIYDTKTGEVNGYIIYNTDDLDENGSTGTYSCYDANGNIIENNREYKNGMTIKKEYDINGKLEYKTIKKDGTRIKEQYNDDGSLSSVENETKEKTVETMYNSDGISSEFTRFKNPKDGVGSIQKVYDNDGHILNEAIWDGNEELMTTTDYRYDDKGNRTGSTTTNNYDEQMICGSDGKVLFFKLKDDDTMYPNLGKWLVDKFKRGESIKDDLVKLQD